MKLLFALPILCAALAPLGLAFGSPEMKGALDSQDANAVAVQLEDSSGEEADSALSNRQRVAHPRVIERLRALGPDGWHRIALYGNWDFVEPEVWRWIVTQPNCDRATALAIFWKAQPDYYVEFGGRASVPAINRDNFDLVTLIRDRWLAGAYTRSELAFDLERDSGPVDLAELERRYGDRVARIIPPSMRTNLPGRRIADDGSPLPGVRRR